MTLTLRHSKTPLRDQLKRLTTCFNALKRREWWKSAVQGGVMFTEIKIGRDGLWHVHCHCIVESSWLDQGKLSDEWHAVTGDSPVVDVRLIRNAEEVAGYVAKYGSKPCDRSVIFSPERLRESISALKGSRLATTFGEWRGTKLSSPGNDTDQIGWVKLGKLEDLWKSEWFPVILSLKPFMAERIVACQSKLSQSG